eukprot:403344916
MVMSTINELQMGKIEFSEGNVDNIKFDLHLKDLNSMSVNFIGKENTIQTQVSDLKGTVSGTFLYKFLFLQTKGKFNVRIDQGACTLKIKTPLIGQSVNGRLIPGIDVGYFNLHIDSSKIHVDLSGSVLADISDTFVALFKSLIMGKITDAVDHSVPAIIKSKANAKIMATNGFASLFDDLSVDFTFTQLPVITDENMQMFMNFTLFNQTSNSYRIPNEVVSDVSGLSTTKNSVQMSVSHYSADSFLVALQDQNIFDYTITKETIPNYAQYLTTTYMDGLLPGLVAKFGRDQPVTVEIDSTQPPRAVFKEKDLAMVLNMDFTFRVNNEVAIVVSVTDLNAHVDVTLRNTNLTANAKVIKISKCSASQSQIGDFDSDSFRAFFNTLS